MSELTETAVARSLSEVLDRVAAGEEIEVTRSGVSVAVIAPPPARLVSPERFRELLATAPAPDPGFAPEVRALVANVRPPDV